VPPDGDRKDGPANAPAETRTADAALASVEKPHARQDNTESNQPPAATTFALAGVLPRDSGTGATLGRETPPELRPGIPDPPGDEMAAPPPLREVSIRITNENAQTADVRMVERNGEIQVAVHASDASLANSLRSDVGDLVRGLAPSGMGVEVWHTGSPSQTAAGSDGRPDTRGGPRQQPGSGQDSRPSGNQQRNGDSERRPTPPWLDDLESIPGASQVRSNSR
jgi:hypothetical protein